jgi:integrase
VVQGRRIEGILVVRETRREGLVYYAKWRDSRRTHRTRRIGPAWVERYGRQWRKRQGWVPEGAFAPNAAAARLREMIDVQESELAAHDRERSDGIDGHHATFREVADAWLRHGEMVAGWKPATLRDRRSSLHVHLLPAFGDRRVREITREEVRRWWRGLHDPRRKNASTQKGGRSKDGRLSDRNANKLLAHLRAIFNWAAEDYRLALNPADRIRKHRELSSERPDFFSVAEVEKLIEAAGGGQDALIFRVCAFAGLRRGEAISLRWRHIDFGRSLMHIIENVSAGQDALVKDAEGRTVPLAPQLALLLEDWRPEAAQPNGLVFHGALPDRKLDGDALSARYRQLRDDAKLRPLRFHDLRHTFGSLAVDGGASLVQVQAWMGHADIKTTMRYLHSKSRTEDAALLAAAFAT